MKNIKLFAVLCVTAFLMRAQQADASMLVDYYRLPPAEREKLTHDQVTWDKFSLHLIKAQSEALQNALTNVPSDGLSQEQRLAKIDAAIKKSRDPAHFNLEKDWHTVAYLLTGETSLKLADLPNAPLHNLIFGGMKTPVNTGYGAVRYFDSKQTAEIAAALAGADRKVIAGRFDSEAMKKLRIYAPPEVNDQKAIMQVIENLTAFFKKAAATHEDVIVFAW